jgi:hypothetical protein
MGEKGGEEGREQVSEKEAGIGRVGRGEGRR